MGDMKIPLNRRSAVSERAENPAKRANTGFGTRQTYIEAKVKIGKYPLQASIIN
jgi:hypothetical protein